MVDGQVRVTAAARVVEHLGHRGGNVVQTASGSRWFAYCGCGYVSTTSTTEKLAMSKLVHHLKMAIRKWRLSGVPIERYRPAPPADWPKVIAANPHLAAYLKKTGASLQESPEKAALTS